MWVRVMSRRNCQPDPELAQPAKGPHMSRTYLQRTGHEPISIDAEQSCGAGVLCYPAHLLVVLATIPYKDPGQGAYCFERSNGGFRLVMMAPSEVGLPWGTY